MSVDHVLLHIETVKDPSSGPPETLGVAVALLYEWRQARFLAFGPNDVEQLRQRLSMADWISGFNLLRLNYPILWGKSWTSIRTSVLHKPITSRTNDILQRISLGLGLQYDAVDLSKDWPLAAVATGTIGRRQVSNGVEGPKVNAEGNWPGLVSYALDTSSVLVELITFIERYGYVVNASTGKVVSLRGQGPRSPVSDGSFVAPQDPIKKEEG